MAAPTRPMTQKAKDAQKASVMFGRQGQKTPESSAPKGAAASTSCCAPLEKIFGGLLGFPDPDKSTEVGGQHYGAKQDLKSLTPVRNFADAPAEAKCGIQAVAHSAAKEATEWINQDSFAMNILPDAGDGENRFFFGVFDGHGRCGHDVSGLIASRLAAHLVNSPSLKDVQGAFKEAVSKVDNDVYANLSEDVEYSGSTCVCCLVDWKARMLHTSNVGDSRAILGRLNDDGSWKAIQLSIDQRPDLDQERERIEMHGGVVSPHMIGTQQNGPARVWDSQALEKPGLACSRSIGDGAARVLGVCATPEVFSRKIEPQDKFIVIGSDGIWDSLSNDQVVDMLKTYLHVPFVGTKALTEAVRRAEGGSLTDDTTMVWAILQK